MIGPNEVLKIMLVGLAGLTGLATVALASIAIRYRDKVLRAERERVELRRARLATNRDRIQDFESHIEDHREALLR